MASGDYERFVHAQHELNTAFNNSLNALFNDVRDLRYEVMVLTQIVTRLVEATSDPQALLDHIEATLKSLEGTMDSESLGSLREKLGAYRP